MKFIVKYGKHRLYYAFSTPDFFVFKYKSTICSV